MILAQRVLTPDEIKSLHYGRYDISFNGDPVFVRLELSVTDDDNLFEDANIRFDHC